MPPPTEPCRRVAVTDVLHDGQMAGKRSWKPRWESLRCALTWRFAEPPYGIEP
jgi:hypothetical protein